MGYRDDLMIKTFKIVTSCRLNLLCFLNYSQHFLAHDEEIHTQNYVLADGKTIETVFMIVDIFNSFLGVFPPPQAKCHITKVLKEKKIIFSKPFTSRIFMSVKLIQENKKSKNF